MATDFHKVKNKVYAQLSESMTNSQLYCIVKEDEGLLFPSDGPFFMSIGNEAMECSDVSGDTINIISRGYSGTIATTHRKNSPVELRIMAETITELQDAINDLEDGVTGPGGNLGGGGYSSLFLLMGG